MARGESSCEMIRNIPEVKEGTCKIFCQGKEDFLVKIAIASITRSELHSHDLIVINMQD